MEQINRKDLLDYLHNHIEFHSITLDAIDKYGHSDLNKLDDFDLNELAELWDFYSDFWGSEID